MIENNVALTCCVGGPKRAALARALEGVAIVAVVAVRVRIPAGQPVWIGVCRAEADACGKQCFYLA